VVKRKDFNATLKQLTDGLERCVAAIGSFHSDGAATANERAPNFVAVLGMTRSSRCCAVMSASYGFVVEINIPCVGFQGSAWSLRQSDGEAGFPGQMAERRRESDDVFKVRSSRHMARCTGLPPPAC